MITRKQKILLHKYIKQFCPINVKKYKISDVDIKEICDNENKLIRKNVMTLDYFLEENNISWGDFHERIFYHSELYPITFFFFFKGKCWFTTYATKSGTGEVEPDSLPKNLKKEFNRYKQIY